MFDVRENNWLVFVVYKVLGALLFVVALVFSARSQPQSIVIPAVKSVEKISVNEYYVASVIGVNGDEPVIGNVMLKTANTAVPVEAILKGGSETYVRNLLALNLSPSKSGYGIVIKIDKLSITENLITKNVIDGTVHVSLSFLLSTMDDLSVPLTSYSTQYKYNRSIVTEPDAGKHFAEALKGAITYLDGWIVKNKSTKAALAKKVVFKFPEPQVSLNDDTIYYNVNRPLTWADFKDRARGTRYAAFVVPGLSYDQAAEVKDGNIEVSITVRATFPKSAAWVAYGQDNAYNLNHEQRHFDIAQIVTKWFKKQLLRTEMSPYYYEGPINEIYFDALRELDRLQKLYDHETTHGNNNTAQQQWNLRIDSDLKN